MPPFFLLLFSILPLLWVWRYPTSPSAFLLDCQEFENRGEDKAFLFSVQTFFVLLVWLVFNILFFLLFPILVSL